jgi:hypothetical protein
MYWVVMTDKFFSGWGPATNKWAVYAHECETMGEAIAVEKYARSRGDQMRVRIVTRKPRSKPNWYLQFRSKEDSPHWYSFCK